MVRLRATAVAIRKRDDRVLLVRDWGTRSFSLPRGGVHSGEPATASTHPVLVNLRSTCLPTSRRW